MIILSRAVALVSHRSALLGPETTKMHTWRKKNEVSQTACCLESMLPQDDDEYQTRGRWLYHLATWLEGAEPPSASSCALPPRLARSQTTRLAQLVLVAVQGPWRLSARADRKTLTKAYLDYTHTVILVTDGEVVRGR